MKKIESIDAAFDDDDADLPANGGCDSLSITVVGGTVIGTEIECAIGENGAYLSPVEAIRAAGQLLRYAHIILNRKVSP